MPRISTAFRPAERSRVRSNRKVSQATTTSPQHRYLCELLFTVCVAGFQLSSWHSRLARVNSSEALMRAGSRSVVEVQADSDAVPAVF